MIAGLVAPFVLASRPEQEHMLSLGNECMSQKQQPETQRLICQENNV